MPPAWSRSFVWALVAVAIMGTARVATGGWGPDGATVRATNAHIPIVAACSDGGTGTFVAWQEITANPAGTLRVQHLLATGDLDPIWPADGVQANSVIAVREFVDLVPDRQGGVYVCWLELASGQVLVVTHLDRYGKVASGWPPEGRYIGGVALEYGRPRIIEDGTQGIFVAWTTGQSVMVQRFGLGGLGTTPWPDAARIASPTVPVDVFRFWPDLAPAPDGGVFVSWATLSADTTASPSGLFLRRLTSAGINSPGWPTAGLSFGSFRPEGLVQLPRAPLIDIGADDRGGLFLAGGSMISGIEYYALVDPRLHRLLADGQPAAGWPSGGRPVPTNFGFYQYEVLDGPDAGLRVHPDGQDGALVEHREFFTDSPSMTEVSRTPDQGPWVDMALGLSAGHEVVPKGDGGVFMADFMPNGPFGPFAPNAFIAVTQSNPPPGWVDWRESHPEPTLNWYGDIALASAANDGVVFFWSQERVRFGLFARRFTTSGQVTALRTTAVEPGDGARHSLGPVRFVRGTGVVARVVSADLPAQLELYDVGGRRIASRSIDELGSNAEITLPGTASIAAGLYFVRLVSERSTAFDKVAVVR